MNFRNHPKLEAIDYTCETADGKSLIVRKEVVLAFLDELERLRTVVALMYRGWPEPWAEGCDGFELQDFGVAHRILDEVKMTHPCADVEKGGVCQCSEYYGPEDAPWSCYRLRPEYLAALVEWENNNENQGEDVR